MATAVPNAVSHRRALEMCVSQSPPEGLQILLIAFVPKHCHDKPFGMVKGRLGRDHLDVKYMECFFMDLDFFVSDFSL